MKKLLLLMVILITTFISKADSWEEMSQVQADKVVAYLHDNPYVLDYCDCCGSDVYLIKVKQAVITTSQWDNSKVSVKISVVRIAKLIINKVDNDVRFDTELVKEEKKDELLVSMNYTFGYSFEKKLAVPFFEIVSFSPKNSCSDDLTTRFPDRATISHRGYKSWMKKANKN